MSNNFFYQTFERIFNNRVTRLSSKDCISTNGTPKFYESCFNNIIYQVNNFALRKVVIEKDSNVINGITQFVQSLRSETIFDPRTSFDVHIPDFPTRQKLSYKELLQLRDIPMYYTISEERILLQLSTRDFKTWFKNEIITILDLLELYSPDIYFCTIPKNIIDIARCPLISSYSNKIILENEVYSYYRRVICLYSLITTDVMKFTQKREQLFKELNFLKKLLESLIVTMDIMGLRFTYFATNFTNHYPRTSFGSGPSRRLRDIVRIPEYKFAHLGDLVVNGLINLL
uniref:tRNA-synt_2 domain-containing protein n=1 Tax=Strongyloides papillosus TaxID=174720 RepID=A0A0N5BQD8_STREA